jgi:hypothetical protein
MMEEIQRSIQEVAQAIDNLNRAFEKHAEHLRQSGDQEKLHQWIKGAQALQDSSHLYLTWANHYAHSSDHQEDESEEDLGAFLDEPGTITS